MQGISIQTLVPEIRGHPDIWRLGPDYYGGGGSEGPGEQGVRNSRGCPGAIAGGPEVNETSES